MVSYLDASLEHAHMLIAPALQFGCSKKSFVGFRAIGIAELHFTIMISCHMLCLVLAGSIVTAAHARIPEAIVGVRPCAPLGRTSGWE